MADTKKSKFAITQTAPIISEESALAQIIPMLEFYDFDIEAVTGEEKRGGYEELLGSLLKHIQRGRLEISLVNGRPVVTQHLSSTPGTLKEITYGMISGESRVNGVSGDLKRPMNSMYGLMGQLSGLGLEAMKKLEGVDLQAMELLASVFFTMVG